MKQVRCSFAAHLRPCPFSLLSLLETSHTVIADRPNQHGFHTPVNLYGKQPLHLHPAITSRIHLGASQRLGLRVSQYYQCGLFPPNSAPRDALHAAFSDPILGLYTNNASAPLNVRAGLRQLYKFGLYSHCAYVNETAGLCTNTTAAYPFQPYTVITGDMLSNYSGYTDAIVHNATFAGSSSLGKSSRSAYYLLLLGSILATISLVTFVPSCQRIFCLGSPAFVLFSGVIKHTWTFFISTSSAIVASIFVLAASALWTTAIKRAEDINTWTVRPVQVPLGIEVSTGIGLYLSWAAFACLATSVIPYMIRSVLRYRLL